MIGSHLQDMAYTGKFTLQPDDKTPVWPAKTRHHKLIESVTLSPPHHRYQH